MTSTSVFAGKEAQEAFPAINMVEAAKLTEALKTLVTSARTQLTLTQPLKPPLQSANWTLSLKMKDG
jgi:hypothetical protein